MSEEQSTSTKIGHGLAKVLGIKLDYRDETNVSGEKILRGESVFSVTSADTFIEREPTASEWLASIAPTRHDIVSYFCNLFPFLRWLPHYNLQWFVGDLVAGITIGAVVVPQGMAYADLAGLPVQYGLYSSFMGVLIYWFFATSKDITIGPVAVMSKVTGTVVLNAQAELPNVPGHVIASALSVVAGGIVCFIGLIRLGWLVEFIPLVAISAFMTGSALNIAAGQLQKLLGQNSDLYSTRDATYIVFINSLKYLPDSTIDAALGITSLVMLYLIRYVATILAERYPNKRKIFFFMSTLRTVFVILLYTMISWLCNMNRRDNPMFSILETVPRGFQHAAVPKITTPIVKTFASDLPATVIVLLIEHISIAKSFGRVNNYTINPSQEMVGIGVTNLLGPFLGAYPATGSFSRTAIKSKAGVRTPFGGVITALVVLLAIYALTAVFFYIPNAALAGVIIHAVMDLITPPNAVYQFWRISPLEVIIFFAGVLVTVFDTIEDGIYTMVCTSVALLLFRVFKARGRFLGPVKVHSVIGDHILDEPKDVGPVKHRGKKYDDDINFRSVFLPIDHHDGTNPDIALDAPYPGIFIYRFSEGYNYPNANHYLDYMVSTIFKRTRRTNPLRHLRPGDRPWNDPGPRRGKDADVDESLPILKAVILDFSSVNNVDVTAVQHLIDVRNQLDRYASPDRVEWHFAHITNRWTKRALTAAGFGYPSPEEPLGHSHRWKPIFSVADIGGPDSAAETAEINQNRFLLKQPQMRTTEDAESIASSSSGSSGASNHEIDIEVTAGGNSSLEPAEHSSLDKKIKSSKAYRARAITGSKIALVHGVNRPFFHLDLTSALQSAIQSAEARKEYHHHRQHSKSVEVTPPTETGSANKAPVVSELSTSAI